MGVADKVQITGPRSESDIIEMLSRASLFVLPCVKSGDGGSDNLPTVIMEAMAMALPVISTPIAGVPEMVIEGQTGYLIPEHAPELWPVHAGNPFESGPGRRVWQSRARPG